MKYINELTAKDYNEFFGLNCVHKVTNVPAQLGVREHVEVTTIGAELDEDGHEILSIVKFSDFACKGSEAHSKFNTKYFSLKWQAFCMGKLNNEKYNNEVLKLHEDEKTSQIKKAEETYESNLKTLNNFLGHEIQLTK